MPAPVLLLDLLAAVPRVPSLARHVREHGRAHGREQLARLRSDVLLGPGPRHAGFDDHARARLRALFGRLEFRSLLARLDGLRVAGPALTTPTSAAR